MRGFYSDITLRLPDEIVQALEEAAVNEGTLVQVGDGDPNEGSVEYRGGWTPTIVRALRRGLYGDRWQRRKLLKAAERAHALLDRRDPGDLLSHRLPNFTADEVRVIDELQDAIIAMRELFAEEVTR